MTEVPKPYQFELRAMFVIGAAFAIVFASSVACMFGCKYYYDMAELRTNELERAYSQYQSRIRVDVDAASAHAREAGRAAYAAQQMLKDKKDD